MVKRSAKARFMAGAHVFPGGLLEQSDQDTKWKGLSGINYSSGHHAIKMIKDESEQSNADPGAVEDIYFKIGAIREVFEETNILIATNNPEQKAEKLLQWRPEVQVRKKDSNKFFEMCVTLGTAPKVDQLYPWAHWVTPKAEKYRYNTLFFLGILNSSAANAIHDSKETTVLDWFSPEQALTAHAKGSIYLPPPTWFMINEMSRYKTVNSLIKAGTQRQFGDTITPVCPSFSSPAEEIKKLVQIPPNRQFVSVINLPGAAFVGDAIEGKNPQDVSMVLTADAEDPRPQTWSYILYQNNAKSKL